MNSAPANLSEPQSIFDPTLRRATAAILLMVALSAFEGLAVAAALPQVAASLGDVELLPWVVTSYLLTSGVATVAAGALVDRLGVRPVYRASVVIFVLGGVLSGLAPTMPVLIAARLLQGAGAGAVNAVGLSAVGLVFPRRLVGRAFAANSTVWGAMSVAGPAIVALLLGFASWRWIFHVNLPLGALALSIGWGAFPAREGGASGRGAVKPLDLALLTLISGGILLTVGSMSWVALPSALLTALLTAVLLRRSRGRDDALLAPRHILSAPLGPLAWTIALLLIGGIGVQSFVPLFISGGRGGGTALTAWSVLFFVLGWTSGANLASRLMDRFTPMQVTLVGTLVPPFALAIVAVVAAMRWPLAPMFACLYVAGAGIGAVTNSALTLVRELASDAELGRATAAHQFVRNLGFAVGNALFGGILLLVVGQITGDVEQIRAVLGEGGGALEASGPVADAVQTGFAVATGICAAMAFAALAPLSVVRRALRS